jgi:hypothetical protein
MRSHSTIVSAAGAEKIAELRGVSVHTARSWVQRDSIPAEHWRGIADANLATLDELAAAAAARPRKVAPPVQAAA